MTWYRRFQITDIHDRLSYATEIEGQLVGYVSAYENMPDSLPLPRAGDEFILVPISEADRVLQALPGGPQYARDGTLIGWVPSTEHPLPEFFPEPTWQPEWGKDPRQTEPRQA